MVARGPDSVGDALQARLRRNPQDREAYDGLTAHYRERGELASLVNLMLGMASYTADPQHKARAYREVGDVVAREMGDSPRAVEYYRQALHHSPLDIDASESLQAVWESAGDYAALTEFLQEHVVVLSDYGAASADIAILRYRLGELWGKQFDRPDEALHHYRKAFDLDPSMLRALYEARQICEASGDLRGVAELYQREADAEPDAARSADLLHELSELYSGQLTDLDGAIAAMQQATRAAPEDTGLLHELVTLLAQRAEGADEQTAIADYERAADTLCAIAVLVPGDEGIAFFESAIGYAPASVTAMEGLEQRLTGSAREAELAGHWVTFVTSAGESADAYRRRVKLAEAYAREGQVEDAMFCLEPAITAGLPDAVLLAQRLTGEPVEAPAAPRKESGSDVTDAPSGDGAFEALKSAEAERSSPPGQPTGDDLVEEDDEDDEDPYELHTTRTADDEMEALREAAVPPRPSGTGQFSAQAQPDAERHKDDVTVIAENPLEAFAQDMAAAAPAEQPADQPADVPQPLDSESNAFEVPDTDEEGELDEGDVEVAVDGDDLTQDDDGPASEEASVQEPAAQPQDGDRPPLLTDELPERHKPARPTRELRMRKSQPPPPAAEAQPDAEPDAEAAAERSTDEPLGEFDERIAELRRRGATLVRERKHDEAAAVHHEILTLDLADREAFNFLDSFYRRSRDHRRRCDLLLMTADDPELAEKTRILRLREAASLSETRLRDVNAAVKIWKRIMKIEPHSDEPKRNLKRLLERAKRWDDLIESLVAEADEETGQARIKLLKRVVGIHKDQRGDADAAADVMGQIVDADPDDSSTRDQLCDVLLSLERYDDALPLLEARIGDTTAKSHKLPLLKKLASLLDEKLGDANGAFEAYSMVLELSPRDTDVLERMTALDEAAGNYERMVQTMQTRAEHATTPEAVALYLRMASVAESELMDVEQAVMFLTQALDLAPSEQRVLEPLCELFERAERYDDLIKLLEGRATQAESPAEAGVIHRRVALLLTEQLQDSDRAAAAWRKVLEHGDDPAALEFLEAHARREGATAELADILGRRAGLTRDKEEGRDLLYERAGLLIGSLERPADAIADLSRILEHLDPTFDPALDDLQAASEACGDYKALSRMLERRSASTEDPDEQRELSQRLSDLYADKLEDPKRQTVALLSWVKVDPDDAEPHRRLVPLLTAAKRYDQLLGSLDALSTLEETEASRTRVTIAAASLLADRLKDNDGAWERLTPLLTVDSPEADAALWALANRSGRLPELFDQYEAAGRYDELLTMLQGRLEEKSDDATRVQMLRRIATLQIEHLDDESGAEAAYDNILELVEDIDALRFIQAAAMRRDDPERLAMSLKRLAALEKDREERRDLLFEYARILHARLGRPKDAIEVLQEILQRIDPNFEAAGDELLAACETAGDFKTMARLLERQLKAAEDVDSRLELARRLADIYDNELDERERAIAALRHWTEADPEDPDPLRRLRARMEQGKPGPELLPVLDALADKEYEREAQLEAHVAAAELCIGALRDPGQAWERLSALVPQEYAPADRALWALAQKTKRSADYYALLEGAERFDHLVEHLEQEAQSAKPGKAQLASFRKLGRLLSTKLDDHTRAATYWTAILEQSEDPEALRFLHARALHDDDADALADALRRLAAIEKDATEQRDLYFEYAHVLHARLDRAADAIEVLLKVVFEIDATFDAAIDELISVCETAGDDANLARGLSALLKRTTDPQEVSTVARRRYELCMGPLSNTADAIDALTVWGKATPGDAEPFRLLRPLLTADDDAERLIATLDALAECEPDPMARADARVEAAQLVGRKLGRPKDAWDRLVGLVEQAHAPAEVLLRELALELDRVPALCDLFEQAQRYDELVQLLQEQAESTDDGETRATLLSHCARVLGGKLGDEMAAAEAWQEVLEHREEVDGLVFLRSFYQHMDEVEQLADVLGRLSNQLTKPLEQRDLLFERALLLGDRLERPAEAISVLRYLTSELDTSFGPAIEELVVVCEAEQDFEGLAEGLTKQLDLKESNTDPSETARRLVDLYDNELQDAEKLEFALGKWVAVAANDPEPHRRRRPLLDARKQAETLQRTLDALATIETDAEARNEAARSSAELTFRSMRDPEGAWKRLAPLVHQGDEHAEELAHTIAKKAGFGSQLASIYVMRAQQAQGPDATGDNWRRAAKVYDELLSEPAEALEAALRMFATDMAQEGYLQDVERLATKAKAWKRLGQVYARLIKQTGSAKRKMDLLLRHAKVLEDKADDARGALKYVLEACKLDPEGDDVYEWAERLAGLTGGHTELQWIYERRAQSAPGDEERGKHLIRAARTADLHLHDREQAMQHMVAALPLTENAPMLGGKLEDLARELDKARPELGKDDARRTLIRAHLELAKSCGYPFGPLLVLRGSQLLRDELRDDAGCFDALRAGSAAFHGDGDILDALHEAAVRIRRFDGLDAQLARLASDEEDEPTKLDLLLRRADLLATELKRYDSAARVYNEVIDLDPNYEGVTEALAQCLRKAGRYQELLRTLDRRLESLDAVEERLTVMREMASVWEVDLKNRSGAVDVWNDVLAVSPDDNEATTALKRLNADR